MNKPTDNHLSDPQTGLVISYFGNSVAVEAANGQVFQCHLKRNQDLPVVGDQVMWQLEKGETGIIHSIMPRRSLLSRGEGHGKVKPIAANIDVIAIVMSPPPIFAEHLVDRYLMAAELLSIQPMLILNKSDLLNDDNKADAISRLEPYRAMSYPVVLSSIYGEGLAPLSDALKGKTAVLVGPSGVGKSSIISALSEGADIRVGDVTTQGIGKHTTTATRLYHLPYQSALIDSPGVREFNLWKVSKEEISAGFKEFQQYKHDCKFRNCVHLAEPGCAVKAAVESGKISAWRYANYQTLMKQHD